MFLKWIVCEVPESKRDAFDAAQRQWESLARVPGLVGQVGGWEQDIPHLACILAAWQDKAAYDAFMRDVHDGVLEQSGQEHTYSVSEVTLFSEHFLMPGQAESFAEAIRRGRLLRVADCLVKPDRTEHFTLVQEEIWKPAMSEVHGMLGGVFSRMQIPAGQATQVIPEGEIRFLVTTFWDDERSHLEYLQGPFSSLRERATPAEDLIKLQGFKVLLEPEWCVYPA